MKISRPQYGLQQEIMQTIFILQQKKSSHPFKQPVDTSVYTDYLTKIQKPMDLSTILKNLKNGVYKQTHQVNEDLDLIMRNCMRYNATGDILKKAHQFGSCIETVWGNFKKQLQRKGIKYNQPINITDEILKRLNILEEKKTRKRVPGLHLAMQKERKNILPQSSILPPIDYETQKPQKQQLPPIFTFQIQKYLSLPRQQKQTKLMYNVERLKLKEQFDEVAAKKIQKYKKILRKKILWCEQKIIQKCLQRKKFKKMQIPNHLSATIEGGKIAQQLNIRKIQMYVKQITYWIEDNSNVLSDYMKDKYVQCCRSIRKCLFRVIRYKKIPKTQRFVLDNNLYTQNLPSINEEVPQVIHEERNFENEKEDDSNYENKMKQFRRMLDKDRGQSTKRDTKIILKNENGEFQVIDWTSDKGKDRTRKDGAGGIRNDIPDQDEKRKIQQRKKQEMRKDDEFIEDYSKKSNVLLIGKYGNKLKIDWEEVMFKKYEFPTQIPINFQFNKQDLHLN